MIYALNVRKNAFTRTIKREIKYIKKLLIDAATDKAIQSTIEISIMFYCFMG